jgi:hypothetical protein
MYLLGGPEMERCLPDFDSMVNEMIPFVRSGSQALEIGEVERCLISMVMALGKVALEEYVSVKGTGYTGRQFVDGRGDDAPSCGTGGVGAKDCR